jgi:5-methylcytosine-specific restriction endonuclease McrA
MKALHKEVCERDHYQCRVCKKSFNYNCHFDENGVNQYVCAHHLESRGAHPEKKFDPDNCITVCLDCHNKIHSGEIVP